jgi:hypothetical protein
VWTAENKFGNFAVHPYLCKVLKNKGMTLNDFLFLAKKYCSDVQYVRYIDNRLVAYGGEATESLFAIDLNIENPELEKIHFKGHINGGLMAEMGIGVPDTYNRNCPLMARMVFTDGTEKTISVSSPSNFAQWIETNCPKYCFSKKPHEWWAGEYLGQTCTNYYGRKILNITLYRKLNEI